MDKSRDPFSIFQSPEDNDNYSAGYPSYPRNFSRDTLISGLLASRPDILNSQLEISAQHQGKRDNLLTGELEGKIHHEQPGARMRGKFTTYNACDTAGLFLIGAEGLSYLNSDLFTAFIKRRIDRLEKAAAYILRQVEDDNIFRDDAPLGAEGYALRVTYWKDSILPDPNGKVEPVYPVFYPQAHFIAARGLLSASRLLRDDSLFKTSERMFESGIKTSMREDGYLAYEDEVDKLRQPSSDELHSLAYIPSEYADLMPLEAISQRAAEHLATPYGYLCTPLDVAENLSDKYHGDKVWIFEQAAIHYGATKFGLADEARVASGVAGHIYDGQELLGIAQAKSKEFSAIPMGNDRQLWSVAAKIYFASQTYLRNNAWL
jgi:hypothetical protein